VLCSVCKPGIYFFSGKEEGWVLEKIERKDKNQMRADLEAILEIYRKLEEQIDIYEAQTVPGEYRRFWRELHEENRQRIQTLSRYMVVRCNR
jgi:hypothetical protein